MSKQVRDVLRSALQWMPKSIIAQALAVSFALFACSGVAFSAQSAKSSRPTTSIRRKKLALVKNKRLVKSAAWFAPGPNDPPVINYAKFRTLSKRNQSLYIEGLRILMWRLAKQNTSRKQSARFFMDETFAGPARFVAVDERDVVRTADQQALEKLLDKYADFIGAEPALSPVEALLTSFAAGEFAQADPPAGPACAYQAGWTYYKTAAGGCAPLVPHPCPNVSGQVACNPIYGSVACIAGNLSDAASEIACENNGRAPSTAAAQIRPQQFDQTAADLNSLCTSGVTGGPGKVSQNCLRLRTGMAAVDKVTFPSPSSPTSAGQGPSGGNGAPSGPGAASPQTPAPPSTHGGGTFQQASAPAQQTVTDPAPAGAPAPHHTRRPRTAGGTTPPAGTEGATAAPDGAGGPPPPPLTGGAPDGAAGGAPTGLTPPPPGAAGDSGAPPPPPAGQAGAGGAPPPAVGGGTPTDPPESTYVYSADWNGPCDPLLLIADLSLDGSYATEGSYLMTVQQAQQIMCSTLPINPDFVKDRMNILTTRLNSIGTPSSPIPADRAAFATAVLKGTINNLNKCIAQRSEPAAAGQASSQPISLLPPGSPGAVTATASATAAAGVAPNGTASASATAFASVSSSGPVLSGVKPGSIPLYYGGEFSCPDSSDDNIVTVGPLPVQYQPGTLCGGQACPSVTTLTENVNDLPTVMAMHQIGICDLNVQTWPYRNSTSCGGSGGNQTPAAPGHRHRRDHGTN